MSKIIGSITLMLFIGTCLIGQTYEAKNPKLVVGIIVDQMRFDHLYKYQDRYSSSGFKRLLREGFNYKHTLYNYIPTVTASGHAAIYTGTTPSVNGIINNNWYDRKAKKEVSNVGDDSEQLIGVSDSNTIGRSPRRLLSTSISDQLRLSTNFRSKVISVSLKDRGAILPGGRTANAAYWHDWGNSQGNFVTSSYYLDELPKWVNDFNAKGKSDLYLDTIWNTLYPIATYLNSDQDNNAHERTLRGKDSPTFPYNFRELRETYKALGAEYQLLWVSPAGNTLLTEFAKEAIEQERLGTDEVTDLINISYSVPDVIGHTMGQHSVEIEDIYLRLDQDISELLDYLDEQVGKDEYVLFLTSDHGAIQVASYLDRYQLPTGLAKINQYKDSLENYCKTNYEIDSLVINFDGEQVYLNHEIIKQNKLVLQDVQNELATYLRSQDGIVHSLSAHDLATKEYRLGTPHKLQNGFHPKRSGDILLAFENGFIQTTNSELKIEEVKGTTHGSGWVYDSHVPLLWYGKNIPRGSSVRKIAITDIAPTLAMLLNLQLPSGSTGDVCHELFE